MAELPKYQQTGRIFSDVPQLDFANVRESFKRSQSIANSLDRLSEFAGKTAQVQVERQAERFAVENPITIEQLQNAQKSGVSADDLIKASGGGTIWQETIRKFQGEQLRSQLEVVGQKALADIQTQVQLGQLTDINEIKAKYESAINGMESPIAQINPESALRFKQSMASTANSFYKEATKKLENDYKVDQQVLSQSNLETTIQVARSTIATINDPQMLNEAKNVLYKRVYEQAKEGGAEFAQAQANSFLKAFEEEKINHFVGVVVDKSYAPDMLTAVTKIREGNFGESTMLYNSLDESAKKKVRQEALSTWSDLHSAAKKEQEMLAIENKKVNDVEVITMLSMPENTRQRIKLAQDLYKKDAISLDTLRSEMNPKKSDEDDGDILAGARAEAAIIYGQITTEPQLRQAYPGLTSKQIKKLLPTMASKVVANAKGKIRVAAGAAEDPMAVIDEPTAKRVQSITNIYDKYRSETNPDGTFKYNVEQASELAINEYPKNNAYQKSLTAQKNSYTSIKKVFEDFNPDTMSVAAYAKKKGLNDSQSMNLDKMYKRYLDNKSITGKTGDEL